MKYRPEIDGLRAVAVLPVIFFHAGFSFFRGGYVGVDIFFVISGYLITTIILNEMEAGKFTIANFYERRARRIIPALTVVLITCLPFAYYWMLPNQLVEFSQSLIAVSLFFSNIFFWRNIGYFEIATELKPLLHTWSLAVEEQYYLFFPLFIILAWRFGKRIMLTLLAVLGFASIFLAQWGSATHTSATFYLLPTRLWEILIGSFAAIYLFQKSKRKSNRLVPLFFINQIISALGLSLILYAILVFDEQTPFPSVYALAPTIGTALIILFASDKTIVGSVLGNKFFVGIGLISYSAYLWHQPIFAFARIRSIKEPSNHFMFALGILSLLLAYLTWKYIEKPFRDKAKFDRKKIFQLATASSVVIISIGAIVYLTEGFGNRIASNGMSYAELDSATQLNYGLNKDCAYTSIATLEQCRTSDNPEILVWGDSFAMHLIPGILSSNPDAKVIQMTQNVCGPIIGIAITNSDLPRTWAESCIEFNNSIIAWLKDNPSVRYVVLSSQFLQYLGNNNNILVNNEIIPADKTIVLSHFEATLAMLSEMGIKPVVFAPPPMDGQNIGQCMLNTALYGKATDCRIKTSVFKVYETDILDLLEKVEKKYTVIRVSDVLCNNIFCDAELNGIFIYRDGGHLAIEGSAYLGKKMNFYKLITSK